ncbi:phosphate ABC transporter, inner membrane subunit PstC [Ignisphaera aggregans DSM 17230]|uniref:Phosphate transport system permease protein n=1 Tax=Ignisphaera aggregans (strain DSM 17230 / JCM 13409 / AQ1.S1) TaxID=583356 RepID=E0SR53_IGNAA|nr:phosphate ABC transporter, inner membrane subunit PstC [Ignisphaera aggregans DSM 17230]
MRSTYRLDRFSFLAITNILIIIAVSFVIYILFFYSTPIFLRESIQFISTSVWNPSKEEYGILFAIGGTFTTATLAIAISLIFSISASIVIVEIVPKKLRNLLSMAIDIAAAIPSVIYGLWGLLILSPILKTYIMDPLYSLGLGAILGTPRGLGTSIFSASIVLAIMVTPYATSIIRERLASIPIHIREALISLGLTKWEFIKMEISYIKRTILTAMIVAYGRAVGETAAVAMVIGNMVMPDFYKIFNPGYTISSLIANQYPNAEAYRYMVNAIFGSALILFIISLAINIFLHIYGEKH